MRAFYFTCILVALSRAGAEIIDLAKCLEATNDLDSCHVEFANKLRPVVKNGDEVHKIKSTDPLTISQMDVSLKDLNIKTTFNDNKIIGLSNYEVQSFKTNKNRKLLKVDLFNPLVTSSGKYQFDGSKSFVKALSDGNYDFSLAEAGVILVIKLEHQNGRVVINEDPLLSIKLGKLEVKLHDLFGGKADNFAKIVHRFIHDNPKVYLDQLKSPIVKEVGVVYRKAFNIAAENVDPSVYGF